MTVTTAAPHHHASGAGSQQVALVDLLDRLLGAGVVLSGDITISLAGVDLVEIKLRALVASAGALLEDR